MKHIYFGVLTLVLFSCTQKETSKIETVEEKPQTVSKVEVEPNLEHQGYQLIKGSDCLSCHNIDKKMAGPSFKEIADRYTQEDLGTLSKTLLRVVMVIGAKYRCNHILNYLRKSQIKWWNSS